MTIDVVDHLVKVERVFIGAYEIKIDIRVTRIDCDTRMTPTALLSSGYCDCECE